MDFSDVEKIMNSIGLLELKTTGMNRQWAENHGISFELMMILYSLISDENVTQKKISATCRMPKQTVNGFIKDLQRQEFVELIQCEKDKRERIIYLTSEGKEYCFKTIKPLMEINKTAGDKMGTDTLNKLLEYLKTFHQAIDCSMNEIS